MISIVEALTDTKLMGAALGPADSWRTWLAALRATFAIPLSAGERQVFAKIAGDRQPPQKRVQELWVIAGRRSGKSRTAAAAAVYISAFADHRGRLAPGETGYVLVLSPTLAQSQLVFGYAESFLTSSSILRRKMISTTASEIRLAGNVAIAVHPASYRSVRGRTLLAVIFDESAFWRDETSANPDVEVYRAVLPSLATTGGMLVGISSPYRKLGLLHAKYRDHFGQDDDEVLVVQGGTELFNPSIDKSLIERAREADPQAALAEWDAEFRSDIAALFDDTVIDTAIDHGRPLELPPIAGLRYHAFVDPSAGRHDAFCVGIGHREKERFVADVVRGRKPPLNPAEVAREYAGLARQYRCTRIVGDAYAGEWVSESFRQAGIEYWRSPLPKSQLYLESLPHLNRGAVSIPNQPQLIRELRLLERRTHRSGRDTVDHGAAGSDDHANVLAGVLYLAMSEQRFTHRVCAPMVFTPSTGWVQL